MHDHTSDHSAEHGHDHRPVDYATNIREQRTSKDAFFKQSPQSPIPINERDEFAGLSYYDIDGALRYSSLALGPVADGIPIEMQVQTSDGAIRDGQRAGVFSFEVGGVEHRLTALRLVGSVGDALFVPFTDATSGPETYGAGRYLDLEPAPDGTYDLDFNLAYAPFCAYSPQYSCPLPPAENRLAAAITAGERNA